MCEIEMDVLSLRKMSAFLSVNCECVCGSGLSDGAGYQPLSLLFFYW